MVKDVESEENLMRSAPLFSAVLAIAIATSGASVVPRASYVLSIRVERIP